MDGFVNEVTFVSTRHWVAAGVPVIVKSFTAVVLSTVVVKKTVFDPSSFLAVIAIFTPLGGIVEVMVTLRV